MSGENTKNYREQDGKRWVVEGELDIVGSGQIKRDGVPVDLAGVPSGNASQLQTGSDTTQRTWTAKDIHDEIARQIAAI